MKKSNRNLTRQIVNIFDLIPKHTILITIKMKSKKEKGDLIKVLRHLILKAHILRIIQQ